MLLEQLSTVSLSLSHTLQHCKLSAAILCLCPYNTEPGKDNNSLTTLQFSAGKVLTLWWMLWYRSLAFQWVSECHYRLISLTECLAYSPNRKS